MLAALMLRDVEAACDQNGVTIPVGSGLNVNIPETTSDNIDDYEYVATKLTTASTFGIQFFSNLGDSPVAVEFVSLK
jgi:hypothetical protein